MRNGMWKQVVDDNFHVGRNFRFSHVRIRHDYRCQEGWLPGRRIRPVARNAWIALTKYVNEQGDVEAVCEGTMLGDNSEHYRNRKALTGDLHGQAPVLWCAYALLAK